MLSGSYISRLDGAARRSADRGSLPSLPVSEDAAPPPPPAPQPAPEDGGSTATAIAERPRPSPVRNPPAQLPPFRVLLHNDDINTPEHIVETLIELTPLNVTFAVTVMREAHFNGLSLILVTHKERAELYQEQFQSKGVTVTIEPAE
ncbi:MAG: ATP-dependent Clp protease adaptor ClpS [Phycisphaerales bacterium]|nr:ATP-dependent Clp protease adaptor ClpS [Phycisphaerales bacterium]